MSFKIKPISTALALVALSLSLQGCVVAALAPTALTLAAEGVSVHSTGKTITENLKDAIIETKAEHAATDGSEEVASLRIAPIPPRKPTPPRDEALTIKAEARAIGDFMN